MNRYTLVRLRNLKEDFIRSAEWRKENKIKFNMENWSNKDRVCAVGAAIRVPNSKTKKSGLGLEIVDSELWGAAEVITYKGEKNWQALVEYIGLDEETLLHVFGSEHYGKSNIKPYDVLRKLDSLIAKVEKGKIN